MDIVMALMLASVFFWLGWLLRPVWEQWHYDHKFGRDLRVVATRSPSKGEYPHPTVTVIDEG